MFIIHLKNGNTLVEGSNCKNWDEVKGEISSMELASFGNELITLPKCSKYFYSTEARSGVPVGVGASVVQSKPIITAKIAGGVMENGQAVIVRADTRGHIKVSIVDKSEIPFKDSVFK